MDLPDLEEEYTGDFGLFGGKDMKTAIDVKQFISKN
jgi:hypothetical protein